MERVASVFNLQSLGTFTLGREIKFPAHFCDCTTTTSRTRQRGTRLGNEQQHRRNGKMWLQRTCGRRRRHKLWLFVAAQLFLFSRSVTRMRDERQVYWTLGLRNGLRCVVCFMCVAVWLYYGHPENSLLPRITPQNSLLWCHNIISLTH
jgi:hypothetical protein